MVDRFDMYSLARETCEPLAPLQQSTVIIPASLYRYFDNGMSSYQSIVKKDGIWLMHRLERKVKHGKRWFMVIVVTRLC